MIFCDDINQNGMALRISNIFAVALPLKEQRLLVLEHKEGDQRHHQERDPEKRNCQGDNHSQKSAQYILNMNKPEIDTDKWHREKQCLMKNETLDY